MTFNKGITNNSFYKGDKINQEAHKQTRTTTTKIFESLLCRAA